MQEFNYISSVDKLSAIAQGVRQRLLQVTYDTKSPHLGSCFSCIDILVSLYFSVMNFPEESTQHPGRDRFIMSKGHACLALYTVLAERGFLDEEIFARYGIDGGTLEHHSKRNLKIGIEASTGSLGHGLGLASGIAKAAKLNSAAHRTYVLMSDGELNEGSVWEAALFSAQHELNALTAVVDFNKIQALGNNSEILNLEPLGEKWNAFGWDVTEVDGHDYQELLSALKKEPHPVKPRMVIAHTVKGKSVSFMENKLLWHYRCPDPDELKLALDEIQFGVSD